MGIVLKFILRSIKEKKFRTFLVLFSITISSALFLASVSAARTLEKNAIEQRRAYFGTAEIVIHAGEKSPSPVLSMTGAKSMADTMNYVVGVIQGSGIYRSDKGGETRTANLELNGYKLEELRLMGRLSMERQQKLEPFQGMKLIAGEKTAEKLGWALGDYIRIETAGTSYRFLISGIAQSKGLFVEDGLTAKVVVPMDTLGSIYGIKGGVTAILAKPGDLISTGSAIDRLSQLYRNYIVRETVEKADLKRAADSITVPLMVVLVLVLCISVFIIYTSFKVMTAERLPMIGTFRSVGAARITTDLVLLFESALYGFCGGMLGCGLGAGVLRLMVNSFENPAEGAAVTGSGLVIRPSYFIFTLLLAVLLSLASAWLPIAKASRLPVKDVVLGKMEGQVKIRKWQPVPGVAALIFILLVPPLASPDFALLAGLLSVVLASFGIVMLIPILTRAFIRIFEKLYGGIFGNIGILAAKNLRRNKSMLNNISLLSMGISALLLIYTVNFNIIKVVSSTYRDLNYDVRITDIDDAGRDTLNRMSRVEGVREVYGLFAEENVEVPGTNKQVRVVMGVDKTKFGDYYNLHMEGDREQLFSQLEQGRNILLSNTLRYKFGVEKGGSFRLQTLRGEREYTVAGFFSSAWEGGQLALLSEKYLKMDFGTSRYNDILVKTDEEPEVVLKELRERFEAKNIYALTKKGFQDIDDTNNAKTLNILKAFSVMAMLIGIFGIFNNFAIGFMERKRSLALLKAVGLGRSQSVKMIFIEALSGGIVGSAAGITAGVLMVRVFPCVLKAIDMPAVEVSYSGSLLAYGLLAGVTVTLAASMSPALKSSRLGIIDSIKYE